MINFLYTIAFILISLATGHYVYLFLGGLPPSLYGMICFTALLHFKLCDSEKVSKSIAWGIRNMGVCFVPAGVGIIDHYELVKLHGLSLVLITFFSTFLMLSFIGILYQRTENKKGITH